MRKLIDTITLISALLTLTMTGGVIYSYLYIKNPENIEKTKGFVKDEIQKGANVPLEELGVNRVVEATIKEVIK